MLAFSRGNQRRPLPSAQGHSAADEPSARPEPRNDCPRLESLTSRGAEERRGRRRERRSSGGEVKRGDRGGRGDTCGREMLPSQQHRKPLEDRCQWIASIYSAAPTHRGPCGRAINLHVKTLPSIFPQTGHDSGFRPAAPFFLPLHPSSSSCPGVSGPPQ